MVRVAEHHLGAGGAKLRNFQTLDRGLRADRHEGRQIDGAVGGLQGAVPSSAPAIDVMQLKRKSVSRQILSHPATSIRVG